MFDPNDLFIQMAARDIRDGSNLDFENIYIPPVYGDDVGDSKDEFGDSFDSFNSFDTSASEDPNLRKLTELEKELSILRQNGVPREEFGAKLEEFKGVLKDLNNSIDIKLQQGLQSRDENIKNLLIFNLTISNTQRSCIRMS